MRPARVGGGGRVLVAAMALMQAAFLSLAGAPEREAPRPHDASRLAHLRHEADVLAAEVERLGGQEKAVLAGLAALTARRDLAMAEAARREAELDRLRGEVDGLTGTVRMAESRQREAARTLARRLRAWERQGPSVRLAAVAVSPDPPAALALFRVLADRARLDRLLILRARQARRQALERRAELSARRSEAEEALALSAAARRQAEEALLLQEQRLRAIREGKVLYEQAAREMSRAAGELDNFLAGRRRERPRGPDLMALAGTLPWPAAGKILHPYGVRRHPRYGTLIPHHGLDIATPFGSPVAAVAPGTVLFADWFPGYGRTVILDHGGGVVSVSAHLDVVQVEMGQEVAGGQVLGTAGDSGSLEGPGLYFEIRRDGRPQDPLAWLAPSPR